MTDDDESKSFARYKPDISLGSILTMLLTIGSVIIWGARLEGRVDAQQQLIDQRRESYLIRFSYIESQLNQQRQELEKSLLSIDRSLQRIEGKLDGKADKK